MRYETYKEIYCWDTGESFRTGDTVSIKDKNGGGAGGCRITKITDAGFHYNQGGKRDKVVKYENIEQIY